MITRTPPPMVPPMIAPRLVELDPVFESGRPSCDVDGDGKLLDAVNLTVEVTTSVSSIWLSNDTSGCVQVIH